MMIESDGGFILKHKIQTVDRQRHLMSFGPQHFLAFHLRVRVFYRDQNSGVNHKLIIRQEAREKKGTRVTKKPTMVDPVCITHPKARNRKGGYLVKY